MLRTVFVCYTTILGFFCVIAERSIPKPPSLVNESNQARIILYSVNDPQKRVSLECEASGNPVPNYRWMKNGLQFNYTLHGHRIVQESNRGTLLFGTLHVEDEGFYQCVAENTLGTAVSSRVSLEKYEPMNLSEEEEKLWKKKVVSEGDCLTLKCGAITGHPKPSYSWVKLSKSGTLRLINDSRIAVDYKGSLHFSNVVADDGGEYEAYACVATNNKYEYQIGNRFNLNVIPQENGNSSSSVIKQFTSPTSINAVRGENVQLDCIFGGKSVQRTTWLKNGTVIDTDRLVFLNHGKSLFIKNIDINDEGNYECIINHDNGSVVHSMNVTVEASPFWISHSKDTFTAEGDTVQFECNAGGVPTPVIQWLKNGKPMFERNETSANNNVTSVLIIENVVPGNTAVYQCNASNIHGHIFTNFFLNVLNLAPKITSETELITRKLINSTVTLKCDHFGVPHPSLDWYRNESVFGSSEWYTRFVVFDDGHLEIESLTKDDEGDYFCRVENKFGEATKRFHLKAATKTTIVDPPKDTKVKMNESAVFKCLATSDPELNHKINWYLNGKLIDLSDNQKYEMRNNTLIISEVVEKDAGIYTCKAETEIDSDSINATLIVVNVPKKPRIIRVTCAHKVATLQWISTGDGGTQITGFTIQHNTSFTPGVWDNTFTNISPVDNRFSVALSPYSNYTFRVVARNAIGLSEPSDPSKRCETKADPPYKNPDNVVGLGNESNSLIISWTPMPQVEHNGPGFYYKVFWKREDLMDSVFDIETIRNWKIDKLLVQNLEAFKRYRVKVIAGNEIGESVLSPNEVIGISGESQPSKSPTNFRVMQVIDEKAVLLAWDPVAGDSVNGIPQGYRIKIWSGNESDARNIIVEASVDRCLVNNLKPFSNYSAHILVFNDKYDGPPSEIIQVNTPEGTPGPVTSLNISKVGSNSVELIWNEPKEPNGVFRGYVYRYHEIGSDLTPEVIEGDFGGNQTTVKLDGLKSTTKYRVSLSARTNVGIGERSFIEFTTSNKNRKETAKILDFHRNYD